MRSTLWIIDGNNLIRRAASLAAIFEDRGMAEARAVLESELGLFRARQGRGHSIVVAYDGHPPDQPKRPVGKGLRVVYPPSGGDADRVVLDEARRAEGRLDVTVVTSDRADIAGRLRGLRVSIESSESFAGRLFVRASGSGSASTPGEEKPSAPSGSQLDHWMKEFGVDDLDLDLDDDLDDDGLK